MSTHEPFSIKIIRPSDMHVHFRDGDRLNEVLGYTSRYMRYGVAMPNTEPPILTGAEATTYARVLEMRAKDLGHTHFTAIKVIYLTRKTTPAMIEQAAKHGVKAVKFYPRKRNSSEGKGAGTTNAHHGFHPSELFEPDMIEVMIAMQEHGLILCLHAENPDHEIMYRELKFIEILRQLVGHPKLQKLKVVVEHVSDAAMVNYLIHETPVGRIYGSITAHHLTITHTDLLDGRLRPDLFCMPVAKYENDRMHLQMAATVDNRGGRFFFGSDSAPHEHAKKYCAEGCAGIFSAPTAIQAFAETFGEYLRGQQRDQFERFMSINGPTAYGLPVPTDTITLTYHPVPKRISIPLPSSITTFMGNHPFHWHLDG